MSAGWGTRMNVFGTFVLIVTRTPWTPVMLSGAREKCIDNNASLRGAETSRECLQHKCKSQGVRPKQRGKNSLTQHGRGSLVGIFRLRAYQHACETDSKALRSR